MSSCLGALPPPAHNNENGSHHAVFLICSVEPNDKLQSVHAQGTGKTFNTSIVAREQSGTPARAHSAEQLNADQGSKTLAPLTSRFKAWLVHIFTMTGLALATLATLALTEGRIDFMWLYLGLAMLIDGVDGTLARRFRVKEVLPWFDGGILDILIDYITWTFIPAIFMYIHLPMGPKPLAGILIVLVLTSSTLCYANEHWKSVDYYFYGFPAAWNIVAVILYLLQLSAPFNIAVVSLFIILTIVPSYWTHPFRSQRFMPINIAAILIWIITADILIAEFPQRPIAAWSVFWISGCWFLLSCAIRTFTGPDRPRRGVTKTSQSPAPEKEKRC